MKSFSTVLITSLLLASAAVPAAAASDPSGFYVSLDGRIDQITWKDKTFAATYKYTDEGAVTTTSDTASASDFSEGLMGLGMAFGYRFSPYFAAEAGFSETTDDNRITDNDANRFYYRMTIRQWQLDGYAFWPLGASGRFRPFVTAGIAYASADARMIAKVDGTDSDMSSLVNITHNTYFQKHEIDWRAGAGLEIGISDDVNGRFYLRYQPYSFGSALDGGVSLGFNLTVLVL